MKPALQVLVSVALVVSVATDLRGRRLLDVINLPVLAALLLLRLGHEGLGGLDEGLSSGVLGALGAPALFVPFAAMGRLGWGDVKLLAVVGAALGLPLVPGLAVAVSLAGAVQGALWAAKHGQIAQTMRQVVAPGTTSPETTRHIPYGIAIAVGAACTMGWDWWAGG